MVHNYPDWIYIQSFFVFVFTQNWLYMIKKSKTIIIEQIFTNFFCISSVFTPNILQTFNLKENSCISFFIQSHENWGMTNHTFWSIYLLLVDLNRITVPHFKEKFTLKTFFYCFKALRWKFWSLCVKILTPQNSKKNCYKNVNIGIWQKMNFGIYLQL